MSQTRAIERPPLVIPRGLMRRSRARRWLFWLGFFVSAAVAAFAALRFWQPAGEGPRFRMVVAERRTITRTVEASGELDVPQRFEVAAPVAGRLLEVRVQSGMRVRRGDILARLDARAANFDVRAAQAAERAARGRLKDAEARYSAAADTRKRTNRMLELDLAQPRHLSQATATEQSALGVRDAARAELDAITQKRGAAELARTELTLRSPVDGFVLSLPKASGALVGPERGTLFTIGDSLEELRLEALVSEADIGAVRSGQTANFRVPAFAEATFSARVERVLIEPERKAGAVSYRVLLVADNRDHKLLPGMTCNVSIAIAEARDVLAVREAALRFTPEDVEPAPPRTRIWTSRDGIGITPVSIVAGISDGAYTQVEAAPGTTLAAGEPIVVGIVPPQNDQTNGPGIRLGGR